VLALAEAPLEPPPGKGPGGGLLLGTWLDYFFALLKLADCADIDPSPTRALTAASSHVTGTS